MSDKEREEPHPSSDLAREAREHGTFLDPGDVEVHTLPESERDGSKTASGEVKGTDAPRTIPPPD